MEDFFGGRGSGWRLLKFQDRSFVMHEEILSEGMRPVKMLDICNCESSVLLGRLDYRGETCSKIPIICRLCAQLSAA